MKSPEAKYFNIGPRLTLTFAVLIALILGGNALLIWQFHRARLQTDRLTGVSQQMIEVLRLQESLLSFHRRLDELTQSKDARRLVTEAEPLRTTLLEQIQRTRNVLPHLLSETRVDPAFLPTLETIDSALHAAHVRDGLCQLSADLLVDAIDEGRGLSFQRLHFIVQAEANSLPVARGS